MEKIGADSGNYNSGEYPQVRLYNNTDTTLVNSVSGIAKGLIPSNESVPFLLASTSDNISGLDFTIPPESYLDVFLLPSVPHADTLIDENVDYDLDNQQVIQRQGFWRNAGVKSINSDSAITGDWSWNF